MLNFTFHNPTIIHFGKGQIEKLGGELKKRAKKILITTGMGSVKKHGIFPQVIEQVKKTGIAFTELSGIQPNPRITSVYKGIELAREEKVDFILAIGGGSVIDASKTIALGVKYNGDVWDFFEASKEAKSALPVGTVLTLAGAGSEMNPNAVITNEEKKRKLAISFPILRPVFSVLDPVYTFTVDKYNTAAGVADIMAHVFEYYLSPAPNTELQDALAEGLIKICMEFGSIACKKPNDYTARANIMWASTLALSGVIGRGKINDWTCHAIEHEISAIADVSHGAGLAVLIPNFMKVVLDKQGTIKSANIKKTREFFNSLGLPSSLKELGITSKDFEKIALDAAKARDKIEDFPQLSKSDIRRILELSS